jgi:uncharacterized protein
VTPTILMDAGPLVAILAERDLYHDICLDTLKSVHPPFLTTWPVLAEVTYLLRRQPDSLQSLFKMLQDGFLAVPELGTEVAPWLATFFAQYRDQDPQLADASLVYLAEQLGLDSIFTIDRRHFTVFRLPGGKAFNLLPAQF